MLAAAMVMLQRLLFLQAFTAFWSSPVSMALWPPVPVLLNLLSVRGWRT